jgi:hypothetical protein
MRWDCVCVFSSITHPLRNDFSRNQGSFLSIPWNIEEHSVRVERTPVSLHPNCKKHFKKVHRGTFREHSGHIWFREHPRNIPGTFKAHSRNIQGTSTTPPLAHRLPIWSRLTDHALVECEEREAAGKLIYVITLREE